MHSGAVFVTLPQVERRKVLRREVNFDVAFSADSARGTTQARQLSEFGMLIGPVDHPRLLLEKHIQLTFALPGQDPCKVRGFCAYVTPVAAGIRFEMIPDDLKQKLARFVNEDIAKTAQP